MEKGEILLWILAGCAVFLPVLVLIVQFFVKYSHSLHYVKMKIERSDDWSEYVYWKKELTNLRWSILPGLTPERVKRIRGFFYRGKHHKKKESDGLFSMLIPSLVGIAVCSVCIAAGTWAWYTATVSTPAQSIQAAEYTVSVTVTNSAEPVPAEEGVYTLLPGEYSVTLQAKDTEKSAKTGYCRITIGDTQYYTDPIAKGASLPFTVKIDQTSVMTILPFWGSYANSSNTEKVAGGTALDLTAPAPACPTAPNSTPQAVSSSRETSVPHVKPSDGSAPDTEQQTSAVPLRQ